MFQSSGRQGRPITCPNCRQPFTAPIEQIIDGGRDPQAKARLLSGRTNVVMCPNCGYEFRLSTPLVYHDASKELLLINVPMELGLPTAEQERVVGQLTNAIVNSLPQEQRKGYLLMPRSTLTVQGMIETILEADGITKEMLEARRAKLQLVEAFLQADPAQWPQMAQEHDSAFDEEFFAILTASAEAALASGRQDVAEQVLALREQLLQLSTVGQSLLGQAAEQESIIQAVASDLNALGNQVSRDTILDLAVRYAHEESDAGAQKLQVLVGLARPAMDYAFFQSLSRMIEEAEGDERTLLEDMRDTLLELGRLVDQQSQAVMQQAASVLQAIMDSDDVDAAIRSRLDLIDDAFLAVLTNNIQHAEQTNNLPAAARLREILDRVMALLEEHAPPAIRFVNELMREPDLAQSRARLAQRAGEFGPELLQLMDALLEELSGRGESAALDRLRQLREAASAVLNGGPGTAQPTREPKQGIILPFSARKRKG